MGRHLATSRTGTQEINPVAIRYTLSKRIAIAEDIKAGYAYREVAARHGVALATIHAAVKDPDIQSLIDDEIVERRRKSMAKIYEYQADCGLSALTPEKWNAAPAASIITAAAIATDKARLLRGESTDNVSIRGSVEMINSEILELKKKREQMFSGVQQNDQSDESAKMSSDRSYPQENGQNVKE
jgi:hypothetical protein